MISIPPCRDLPNLMVSNQCLRLSRDRFDKVSNEVANKTENSLGGNRWSPRLNSFLMACRTKGKPCKSLIRSVWCNCSFRPFHSAEVRFHNSLYIPPPMFSLFYGKILSVCSSYLGIVSEFLE